MTYIFEIEYTTLIHEQRDDYETNQGYIINAVSGLKAREKGVSYFENNNFYMEYEEPEVKQINECEIEEYLNRNYQDLREEI